MLISISLALVALSAGLFLLAKTNKENLGLFYKTCSLFVIIFSFVVMALSIAGGVARRLMHHEEGREGHFHKQHHKHRHRFYEGRENEEWNRFGMNRDDEDRNGSDEECEQHGSREHRDFGPRGFSHEGFDRMHWKNSNPEERIEHMSKRYRERLNLNPDQQLKLKEILKASMQKEKEIREKSSGNHDEFKKLSHENRDSRNEAIKKILTPEQLKQFNEQEASRQMEHQRG